MSKIDGMSSESKSAGRDILQASMKQKMETVMSESMDINKMFSMFSKDECIELLKQAAEESKRQAMMIAALMSIAPNLTADDAVAVDLKTGKATKLQSKALVGLPMGKLNKDTMELTIKL